MLFFFLTQNHIAKGQTKISSKLFLQQNKQNNKQNDSFSKKQFMKKKVQKK